MPIIDITLIVFLSGFVFYGLYSGLVKMLGYLFGLIAGTWAAAHYYSQAYDYISWLFFHHEGLGKIICFLIILMLVSRLVQLLFMLLDKVVHILSIIPFLGTINRLLGAIFGLIEGIFILGLIVFIASKYVLINSMLGNVLSNSQLAPELLKAANVLSPLFPDTLKMLKSII